MELGYVYVISTPFYLKNNVFKIGCTKNLMKRLKTLNSTRFVDNDKNYNDEFFVKMFWMTKHYFELESGLHRILKDYRKNNEFFKCSYDEIERAVQMFADEKTIDYIFDDAVLIPAFFHNLKCFTLNNTFSIEIDDVKYILSEQQMLDKVREWLYKIGNERLLKYSHPSFWDKLIDLLKRNFNDNDTSQSILCSSLAQCSISIVNVNDISQEMIKFFL